MGIRVGRFVLPLILAAAVPAVTSAIALAQSSSDTFGRDGSDRIERGDRSEKGDRFGRDGFDRDGVDRGEWSRRGDRGDSGERVDRGDRPRRERMTAEMRARLLDGEVALVKTTLRLTEPQLKLWAVVEDHMRSEAASRRSQRGERRWSREDEDIGQSRGDRSGRRDEMSKARGDRMATFAAVFEPFYNSLDGEQKVLADFLMGQDEKPRGRRWAMDRDRQQERQFDRR